MEANLSRIATEVFRTVSPVREIMQFASPEMLRSLGVDEATFISFGGGWVNHPSPAGLRDSYLKFIQDPALFHLSGNYSPTNGEPGFKRSVAAFEKALFGVRGLEERHIVVGQSSTQLTALLMRILLDPEDSICILDPSYCNYPLQLHTNVGNRILRFPVLDPETYTYLGATPETIGKFERFLGEHKPKVVLLVSPDNPTSQVLPHGLVVAAKEAVKAYGGIVVMDFAYKTLVFGEHPDYFSWAPDPNFISIHSNSKWCHGLGRRLGWIEASENIIEAFESFQNSTILCPDRFHQLVMADYLAKAIGDGSLAAYVEESRKAYQKTAEATVQAIQTHLRMPHLQPQGGLYTCIRVDENGAAFVQRVLKEAGVLLIPGWGFGTTLNKSVRLSFGPHVTDPTKIGEGLRRAAAVLGKAQ